MSRPNRARTQHVLKRAKVCRSCHIPFTGPGAISLADDTTEVCPTCGVDEALRVSMASSESAWPLAHQWESAA